MNNKLKKQAGFTLIEILVVIGIIAILATIVLIAINPARQFAQSRDSQRTSNVNAILNAIGQYIADNKGAEPTIPGGEVNAALCGELLTEYLPALPTDPDSASEGAAIEDAGCAGIVAGAVGYDVTQGADGRITVSAQAEIDQNGDGVVDGDDLIEVTR